MLSQLPTRAYIALGANLGDRQQNVRKALGRLDATVGVRVIGVSEFLENPAVGGPADSPAFVNAVAEVQTTLPARKLLAVLLRIEESMGRQRTEKWGPRTIDLDILLYGDAVIDEQDLAIPHPRMLERRFVLQPLNEIAPEVVIPSTGKTVRQAWEELRKRENVDLT